MFNFSIGLKAKMIEALEKSPNVRWVCWGIIIVLGIIFSATPIVLSLIDKLL